LNITCRADLRAERAEIKADQSGLQIQNIEYLLEDECIEIVLNLTTPRSHISMAKQLLQSENHVYTEKPLVLNGSEGVKLLALAKS
jgi:predicted dehydrogenase